MIETYWRDHWTYRFQWWCHDGRMNNWVLIDDWKKLVWSTGYEGYFNGRCSRSGDGYFNELLSSNSDHLLHVFTNLWLFWTLFECLDKFAQDVHDDKDDDNMESPLLDVSEHNDMSEVEQRHFQILTNRLTEIQNLHTNWNHCFFCIIHKFA